MDINAAVARNLKRVREERGLSLDQTAKLTGVSKSMLGQIERGAVNPTISVVWKIAVGLKVSFTSLVEDSRHRPTLIRRADTQPMLMDGGRYRNYPMFAYDERTGFEAFYLELLPGAHLCAEAHLPGCEEYIMLCTGTLEVTVDAVTYRLDAGDGLRYKADVPHAYRNTGDVTAIMSMVITYARAAT